MKVVRVRLPEWQQEKLEKLQAHLQEKNPSGRKVTVSDAIRWAVQRGLDEFDNSGR